MKKKVHIFDTTLRDGEQSPGCSMDTKQKVRMGLQLCRLGVDVIEAGFPIASEGDFSAVRAVAQTSGTTTVAALCRTRLSDITRAWEAICVARSPRLHTFIATSELHMQHKLHMSRREVLQAVTRAVSKARGYTDNVEFSAEDASRSDLEFLCEVVEVAIRAGAGTINLPDTVGYATPVEYGRMFAEVSRRVPASKQVTLSAHTHNDLGLAVANALAAVENGACQVECTINGIGERAGNAALEEVVMALHTRPAVYGAETGIDTRQIYPTSQLLSTTTGVNVQPNKAIVGRNAFAHEAGIHQHGVLQNALTYEIILPEAVGVPGNRLVIGKHSGRFALRMRCRDLGYPLDDTEVEAVYREAIALADVKKEVNDADLTAIVQQVRARKASSAPAEQEARRKWA